MFTLACVFTCHSSKMQCLCCCVGGGNEFCSDVVCSPLPLFSVKRALFKSNFFLFGRHAVVTHAHLGVNSYLFGGIKRLQMMFILMRNRNIFHMILVWTYRQIWIYNRDRYRYIEIYSVHCGAAVITMSQSRHVFCPDVQIFCQWSTQHPVRHPVIAHWCIAIKVNTLWPAVGFCSVLEVVRACFYCCSAYCEWCLIYSHRPTPITKNIKAPTEEYLLC